MDEDITIIDSDSNDVIIINDENENDNKQKHETNSPEPTEQTAVPEETIEFVEESSESEPELECDIWDDDCVTVHYQSREKSIGGFHLVPTCPQEHEVPPLKKQKILETPELNAVLKENSFIEIFKDKWTNDSDFLSNSVELFTNPYKFCIVDDFITDTTILKEIRNEFNELKWNKRNMDLYEFFQSEDLINIKSKYISNIHEFLKTDIKDWLQKITGFELYKISATCSVYSDTDYLLIHDDLQEDRLIAFVLYITDPVPNSAQELWTKEMGGLLELFSKDEKGHPLEVVRQIVPKNNCFIFFEVSNASYHQVSEILNMDHSRLSINGWFHTPNPIPYTTPELDPPQTGLFSSEHFCPLHLDLPLSNWISPQYLRKEVKTQIQQHVEGESEISLNDFFKEEKFQELCNVLENDDIIWEKVGPVNRRNYEIISAKVVPSIVTEILSLFQSKNMFNLLHEYTDLDLNVDIKKGINPTMRYELQRWKPGSYALFSEFNWESEKELDLIMYLGNTDNLNIVGGQTMYVSVNEKIEDALVTLQPKVNSLNIVFRDTARIVKHVSKRSFHDHFYVIVCSYKE